VTTPRIFDRVPSPAGRIDLLNYHVRTVLPPLPPRSYTWTCATHLDQGQLGSCVGNGFTHDALARPKAHKGLTETDAVALYHRAQQLDDSPGENYEGTTVLAGAKASAERGWLVEYRWATTVDDIIATVGHVGPVVIGVNWYEGMMDTDAKGFIHPTGPIQGGHCIMIKGVNLKAQRFTLHQSWGTSWGRNGDCYLSFADMAILLAQQGEAAVPIVKK
jgi:hypothetical protein